MTISVILAMLDGEALPSILLVNVGVFR